ncbi:ATP-binding protein [bacterium]|nr:MAG: ATP-binding protein [bacterium]
MALSFQRATKKSARLRMALIGVAGAGKTYTALSIAQHLGEKIAVIDTERGSASKYSDQFDFDVLEIETYSPKTYIEAMEAAEEAGYDVLVIDSLSHAWVGKDGALEQVDKAARRTQSGNNFGAWRDVTPQHNAMVDAMISSKMHIIGTMRAKTEYVQEKDPKSGRTTIRKVGMAPIQRDGLEYEFDVVADLDADNNFIVGKTRCPQLSGAVVNRAGREVARTLKNWLTDGAQVDAPRAEPRAEAPKPQPKAAKPAPAPAPVEAEDDFEADDVDAVHCDCGIPAKYVRGKSGAGWVCGHVGTEEPTCGFRMKEAPIEVADDPFAEEAPEPKVHLNGAHG